MTHRSVLENQQQFPVSFVFFCFLGKNEENVTLCQSYLVDSLGDEKIAKKIIIKLKSHSSFKKVVRYVKGCCHQMSLTTTDAKTST